MKEEMSENLCVREKRCQGTCVREKKGEFGRWDTSEVDELTDVAGEGWNKEFLLLKTGL